MRPTRKQHFPEAIVSLSRWWLVAAQLSLAVQVCVWSCRPVNQMITAWTNQRWSLPRGGRARCSPPAHHACLPVVANNLLPGTSPRFSHAYAVCSCAVPGPCVRMRPARRWVLSASRLPAGCMLLRVPPPALWRWRLRSGLQPRLQTCFIRPLRLAPASCLFYEEAGEGDTVN